MHAGLEPVIEHHGVGRVRRRVHDVGAAHGVLILSAACDANLGELAHAREHLLRRAGLHARSEDRQHPRVLARERARRQRRGGRGAHRGDVRPVHDRDRRPVLRVEHDDLRLVRRPVDVAGEEGDELAPEAGRGQVRGHRAEQAGVAGERCDARRHRGCACRQLHVCARERVRELVEIEQLLHLGAAEHEHQRRR